MPAAFVTSVKVGRVAAAISAHAGEGGGSEAGREESIQTRVVGSHG